MNSPQVSILVAAYNAADTLPRCIDSLRQQTLTEVEVLCVDDCSTDDTYTLLCQYARQDERIRVWRTPVNSGQAVARNMALNFVHAPYVCMVDADDWLSADCLEQGLRVFQEHPATDCVVFRLTEAYEDGHEADYGLPQPLADGQAMSGMEAFEACMDGWRLHGLYLTRTELHKQIPFDTATRLYSDDNTSRLHYLHSREVRACDGIYYYRKHNTSATSLERFSMHHFDFMEANLSLKRALQAEQVPEHIMRRFEGSRWMTFLACYRRYLAYEAGLSAQERQQLQQRLATVLATFSRKSLPLSFRCRPGYWLLRSAALFDLQQRFYRRAHSWLRNNP